MCKLFACVSVRGLGVWCSSFFFLSRSINKVSELLIIYVPINLPFYKGSECHLYSFNPAQNEVVEIYCERWSWNRYSEGRTWVQQTIRPGSRNKIDCWKNDGKSLMLYFMLYTLVANLPSCPSSPYVNSDSML